MGKVEGLVAIAVGVVLLLVARPRSDEVRPFLRSWPVLVGYIMLIELAFIGGIAALITNWG